MDELMVPMHAMATAIDNTIPAVLPSVLFTKVCNKGRMHMIPSQ